ncbi:hypothetical protein K9U38_21855, partial [Phyllobacterium sp. 2063]|nr:hypothetical protein [Phyllobacterium sp. 2063]
MLYVTITSSQAQTVVAPPPPARLEELIKLLDDPEIKAWINTKGTTQPAAEVPAEPGASDFMPWSNTIRAHLRRIAQAIPAVPGEFVGARSTIMTEISGHRPGAILVLFVTFAALGFGAEFAFRRLVSGGSRNVASATMEVGTPARHHLIGRTIFAAIAPLIVFTFASIGAFLAFTWPPLLAAIMLPMLVALIAWRVIIRMTAILLGTDRRQLNDGNHSTVRLIPMDDVMAAFWYRRIALFTGIFFTGWAVARVMIALDFTPSVRSLIVYIIGLGLLAVAVETVWHRPEAP